MNQFLAFPIFLTFVMLSMPVMADDEEVVEHDEAVISESPESGADEVPDEKEQVSIPVDVEEKTTTLEEQVTPVEVPPTSPDKGNLKTGDDTQVEEAQKPTIEDDISLAQASEGIEQADSELLQAEAAVEKTQQGVEDLLSKMGDNPTPAQREEFKKTVTSFVAAAEKTNKAEQKANQAKEKAVSLRIQDNISSNTPSEPGF